MRKMILALLLLCSASVAKSADNLIRTTLLDHVTTVTQFRSGETRLAMMDSVILIGDIGGKSVLDIQVGFNGATKPEESEVTAANILASGWLKIRQSIRYAPEWEFLNAVEHGPYIAYDFRRDGWYGGYQIGLPFDLNPK